MKKSLIAMAVVAGMAAPLASNADVKVYGKVNMGVAQVDNGTDSALVVFDEASRLGFKGSEDLGGGLSAIYKAEGTVDMDGASDFNFNRDTFIGLKGGFGTVRIGRFNTAYKSSTGKLDIFSDRNGDSTGNGFLGEWDQRENNMISYTNKFGAIKLGIDLIMPENADDDTTTTVDEGAMGNTISIAYGAGPIYVSVASATAGGSFVGGTAEGDGATKIGFQYKTGAFKVNLISETQTREATGAAEPSTTVLQGAMMSGSNTFALSIGTTDGDGTDANSQQIGLGWIKKVSKTTEFSVVYSAIDNEANANARGRLYSGVDGLAQPGNDDDPSNIAAEITYKF